MQHADFLFAANMAVWIGIGAYVAFLAMKQRRLTQRCQQLELMRDDQQDS